MTARSRAALTVCVALLLGACRQAPAEPPAPAAAPPDATLPIADVRDPWFEAAGRGIDFRAVGQEPGWSLEIDNERSMHLVDAATTGRGAFQSDLCVSTRKIRRYGQGNIGRSCKVRIEAVPRQLNLSERRAAKLLLQRCQSGCSNQLRHEAVDERRYFVWYRARLVLLWEGHGMDGS